MSAKLHVCPFCEARWNSGGLRVDVARGCVSWGDRSVSLRPLEARLLAALADALGRVVRREYLIDAVWGNDARGGPDNARKAMHVHVHHMRRRLAAAGFPGQIKAAWGVGYELQLAA